MDEKTTPVEQGAYQTTDGEREKALYEHLDALAAALSEHPLGDALQDELWHVVWSLTGSDPAKFRGARRWLKTRVGPDDI